MIEADPNGKSANEGGAKLDAGKNRLGLVLCGFARALQEVGKVGTYGANKYTDNGWMEVPDGEQRYTDALLRHLMSDATGEKYDPDTGLHHAAHAAWNALARLDLALRPAPLNMPIEEIPFSSRTRLVLKNADIKDLYTLLRFTERELRRMRNISYKTVTEIKKVLEIRGLHLKVAY